MADDKKDVYLQIPAKWWWELRKQFNRSVPGSITDTYLRTVLGLKESSVKGVAIPGFKSLGIINADGTVNDERARAWRDDDLYPQVCQAIIKERYPQELIDTFPEPTEEDRGSIEQWFALRTGVGNRARRAMAAFFLLLNEADASKAPETIKSRATQVATKAKTEPKSKVTEEPARDQKKKKLFLKYVRD